MTVLTRALLLASILCAPAGRTGAAPLERTATLVVQPTSITEIGLRLPLPATAGDTAQRRYSGDFSCRVAFDTETLAVESFKFLAGAIYVSAYALEFGATVTYPSPYGARVTYVTRQPTSVNFPPEVEGILRLIPKTVPDTGLVGEDGTLVNLQHRLHANAGRMVTGRAVSGSPQPSLVDNYYDFPTDLPFPGTAKVEVREVSADPYERTVRIVLTLELDERVTLTLPGSVPALKLDVVETETGTVLAQSTQFKVPTAYGQWATDNHLVKPDPEARNAAGIPYGILFALDLPATATSLPLSIELRAAGPVVVLELPEGGLLHPMRAEYSPDLSGSVWPTLGTPYYLDGADSLDLGATGSPAFAFPAGSGGFLRFATTIDP